MRLNSELNEFSHVCAQEVKLGTVARCASLSCIHFGRTAFNRIPMDIHDFIALNMTVGQVSTWLVESIDCYPVRPGCYRDTDDEQRIIRKLNKLLHASHIEEVLTKDGI